MGGGRRTVPPEALVNLRRRLETLPPLLLPGTGRPRGLTPHPPTPAATIP